MERLCRTCSYRGFESRPLRFVRFKARLQMFAGIRTQNGSLGVVNPFGGKDFLGIPLPVSYPAASSRTSCSMAIRAFVRPVFIA